MLEQGSTELPRITLDCVFQEDKSYTPRGFGYRGIFFLPFTYCAPKINTKVDLIANNQEFVTWQLT